MNLREWALPLYTILIQLATGALLTLWVIRALAAPRLEPREMGQVVKRPLVIILFTIFAAMVGSQFHLSRPLFSFLAVLNIASSWLSREILFTVLFFLATLALTVLQWRSPQSAWVKPLGWLAIGFGVASIYCMSRIYDLPIQVAWNSHLTTASFYATTLLLGVTALPAMMFMDSRFQESVETQKNTSPNLILPTALPALAVVAAVIFVIVIWLNIEQMQMLQAGNEVARTSLQLLLGLYGPLFAIRLGVIVLGVGSFALAAWRVTRGHQAMLDQLGPVYLGFLLVIVGEFLGRFLFYAVHIRQGI